MNEPIDYEKEYNARLSIPDHVEIAERWTKIAAAYRDTADCELDIAYGQTERTKFDFFRGLDDDKGAPVVIYIHGGYWRSRDRKDFSHVAAGLNARGISVAIPSYDLCPDVGIGDILGEMQFFLLNLWEMTQRRMVISGHSAGGHLAASLFATDWSDVEGMPEDVVHAACAISGLYDLRPLCKTSVNEDLGLTPEKAELVSPLIHAVPRPGSTFIAAVGALESGEFKRQSQEIADSWGKAGVETEYVEVADANHLTVVDALTERNSSLTDRIASLAEAAA